MKSLLKFRRYTEEVKYVNLLILELPITHYPDFST
jgi:hypothetical protein